MDYLKKIEITPKFARTFIMTSNGNGESER